MFDTIKTRDNTRQFFEIINKSKTEEEIKSEYVRIYDILPKKISDPPLPQNAATTFLNVINGQKSLLQLYNHIMIMANRIDYTNQIRGIYNEKAPAILDSIMTKLRKDPDSLPTDINKDVFIQEYNKFFKRESTLQGNVYSPRNAPTISISYQSDTYTDGEVAIPVLQPGADYYNIRTSEGKSHLITDYGIIIRN